MAKKKKMDEYVLKIDGPLTIHEAQDVHKEMVQALKDAGSIKLDMSHVTDCDTAGVQLLYSVMKTTKASKKNFVIAGHSQAVQEALNRTELVLDMEM